VFELLYLKILSPKSATNPLQKSQFTQEKIKMKKILLVATLIFISCFATSAQQIESKTIKKEYSFGFNFNFITRNRGFAENRNLNGINSSYKRKINRFLGVKAQFSGNFSKDRSSGGNTVRTSVYNYLGGIEVKDNSRKTKIKPFAHLLFGLGNVREKTNPDGKVNGYGLSYSVGGGLEIKASKKISLKVAQVEYNPINVGGKNMKMWKVGFGITFH
jgi:opacity protein-like surface antigen